MPWGRKAGQSQKMIFGSLQLRCNIVWHWFRVMIILKELMGSILKFGNSCRQGCTPWPLSFPLFSPLRVSSCPSWWTTISPPLPLSAGSPLLFAVCVICEERPFFLQSYKVTYPKKHVNLCPSTNGLYWVTCREKHAMVTPNYKIKGHSCSSREYY